MRTALLLALVACTDRPIGEPDDPIACTPVAPAQTTVAEGVGLVHAVWNGDGYGIAWYGLYTGAFFARADARGVMVPNSTRQVSPAGLFPRLAFDGTHFGIAFAE